MSLDLLAATRPYAEPLAVPQWTLGCFHRRCITFATGVEDTSTRVIWIQSHGLTGDLRLPLVRPDVRARGALEACTEVERAELARGEGFVARTSWDGALMHWDAFAAFQPYEKWPEPGRLERVGACLVEWAPSGIYVEDWRLQPGASGLSVGLQLVSETGADGVCRRRTGGLVIAGDHALMLIGRRTPLPAGRAHEILAADPGRWEQAFDCEVAYAVRHEGAWPIQLAVNPLTEGSDLLGRAVFEPDPSPDLLVQRNPEPGAAWRERLWRIDTLRADLAAGSATSALPGGLEWLARESDALGISDRQLVRIASAG
jgi:hypothetical protein